MPTKATLMVSIQKLTPLGIGYTYCFYGIYNYKMYEFTRVIVKELYTYHFRLQ